MLPQAQKYLGITTQDGLFVYRRMPFGLASAPMWCQYAMDLILARAGVTSAKGFFDDVTVPGSRLHWRRLWEDTMKVMRALTSAGLMIGL